MSISVIVPTVGRPSLTETLLSILPQLAPEDEVIVSADGLLNLYDVMVDLDHRIHYIEFHKIGDYGNTARDRAIAVATGTHLVFCDDDDILVSSALASVRRAIKVDPNTAWIFKMKYGKNSTVPGLILWDVQEVKMGHVGTPMLMLPNKLPMPSWADAPKDKLAYSDYFFIDKVYRMCYDSDVRWDSDVLCLVRPSADEIREELYQ